MIKQETFIKQDSRENSNKIMSKKNNTQNSLVEPKSNI